MDFRALLNKRIAGVPVYVVVLVLAAAALYGAWKLKPTPDETAPADESPTTADETLPFSDTQPIFDATPPLSVGSVTSTNADSNDLWGRRAIEYLTGSRGHDYSSASLAIGKFLDGMNLTYDEGAMRDEAIAALGLPPEPVGAAHTGVYRGPASRQGEPPLNHIVKGKSDDNAQELARLYYGQTSQDAIELIRSANTSLTVPYPIGSSVHIPGFHRPKYFTATRHTRTVYQIAQKNGTTADKLYALNPGMSFPVSRGTQVRVA